jgi:predicted HTH transcriptional regulator
MSQSLPLWADGNVSASLPNVRTAGEGPTVEFMLRFPEQAHDLAKEMAAFGTSGGGTIFLGINNNGELIGLGLQDDDARDKLAERMHGVVNMVRPDLNAEIVYAVENKLLVLAVVIPKQTEPAFYYNNVPYIRDKRRSRPATPEEVKRCVWVHPSSEHRREMERLEQRQADNMIRIGEDFANLTQESRRQHLRRMGGGD